MRPWRAHHNDGGEYPEDAFCTGEKVTIGGVTTYLDNGTHDNAPVVRLEDAHDRTVNQSMTPEAAGMLAQRLLGLSTWVHAPEVARSLERGDFHSAAGSFLARLRVEEIGS